MRLLYYFFFTFLIACAAQGPWQTQNQRSWDYPPNGPYNPNNPYNQGNQNNPYNPNNPYNQGDQNNPYNQGNQNNPYNPGNSNDFFKAGNSTPNNPFPEGTGVSRTNDLPYEFMLDTITSLTCEETITFDGENPYVFTAGSYRSPYGGVRISEDFIRNNKIEKSTPYQKVQQILNDSPLKRARAQLSVRSEHDVRTYKQSQGKPLISFFPPFTNPDTLHKLSRQEINFSTRSSSSSSVINSGKYQAFLPIHGGAFIHLASSLGEKAIGDALIYLVYSLGNNLNPIYSPERKAYGSSYKLRFNNSNKADYLTGIDEENLIRSKREGRWICPIRFMVHDSTGPDMGIFNVYKAQFDRAIPENLSPEGFCNPNSSPQLSRLEKQFFEEEFGSSQVNRLPFHIGTTFVWSGNDYYDTKKPCIVPKPIGLRKQTCYPYKGFYRIEFDPSKECSHRARIVGNYPPKDSRRYKACPAYLSACFRVED